MVCWENQTCQRQVEDGVMCALKERAQGPEHQERVGKHSCAPPAWDTVSAHCSCGRMNE